MKIYEYRKLKDEVFTTRVDTKTRELEIKVESYSDGNIRYSLYDLGYKEFGGLDILAYAEPLDGFFTLYTNNSKKPFGIAKDEGEAHDRLMLQIQRRVKRIRFNEKNNPW